MGHPVYQEYVTSEYLSSPQEQRLANDLPPKYEDIVVRQAEEGKIDHQVYHVFVFAIWRKSDVEGQIDFYRFWPDISQKNTFFLVF